MKVDSIMPKIASIIRQARYHILFAVGFFIAGGVIGFHRRAPFMNSLDYLSELARYLENRHLLFIIMFIFFKNALASLIAIWSGTLLGIIPVLVAVQNGVLVGVVLAWKESFTDVLLNILPHGMFELPAFFIACGLGMWRGTWIFRRNREETYKKRAQKGYLVYFLFIIPLLLIAATIEGFRIAQIRLAH